MTPEKTDDLQAQAGHALQLATQYARDKVYDDGHWLGPMSSDVTITAEWLFLAQALGLNITEKDNKAYRYHFLASQQDDGSWAVTPNYPYGGNLSATIEAYLALKILGLSIDDPAMTRAREYIRAHGGAARMRIFTRFHFAMFGLLPWSAVPQMPPELVFLPSWFPVNLYRFSSWARITIVPFLVIRTHEPTYPLPDGPARLDSDYLDELWLDPTHKNIPYAIQFVQLLRTDWMALFFQLADIVIWLVCLIGLTPFRHRALKACATWLLDRQEDSGDWAGIFPPMHLSIYALLLEGHSLDSDPVQRGLAGLDRFLYQDEKHGLWMQPCVSPVWDTFLMVRGLLDANTIRFDDELITKGLAWTKARQLLVRRGDWRVYRPHLEPGGWSFEYDNTLYPDVDDTAAGILAFLKQDPAELYSYHVVRAAVWVLGMQNADGGWAAFDVENDAHFLNSIPFSDMDALCDTSCPDIVGRVLEAFGLMLRLHRAASHKLSYRRERALFNAIEAACRRGLAYLERSQEASGGWFGRWGANYIYGTSNVLCGLEYFAHDPQATRMVPAAVRWLEGVQNTDGGWGERLDSYVDVSRAGRGDSTPSQTAWALMGLLAAGTSPKSRVVGVGVAWLVSTQLDSGEGLAARGGDTSGGSVAGTWEQTEYTGTGFPGHFYLGYDLYRHYFPMMALGRYRRALQGEQ